MLVLTKQGLAPSFPFAPSLSLPSPTQHSTGSSRLRPPSHLLHSCLVLTPLPLSGRHKGPPPAARLACSLCSSLHSPPPPAPASLRAVLARAGERPSSRTKQHGRGWGPRSSPEAAAAKAAAAMAASRPRGRRARGGGGEPRYLVPRLASRVSVPLHFHHAVLLFLSLLGCSWQSSTSRAAFQGLLGNT